MAPSKSSSLAKKTDTAPSPSLKQGKLSFAAKRTSSAAGAKSKTSQKASQSTSPTISPSLSSERVDVEINSDSDSDAGAAKPRGKRAHAQDGPSQKKRKVAGVAQNSREVLGSRAGAENVEEGAQPQDAKPELDLQDKSGRWRKHYSEVKAKMGHLEPVHGNGQTKIHQILRVFDLSYEYGPCVGVSRMQRWERAEALGLNPPPEVKEILLTKQGSEKTEFSQCVFYGEV